ncbi:flagellar hook-length control protein FliK [Selenomonas sp.]|uniref:flagellar hook-length control protein FliK n=1 Tax=Selenomonas sp. TaxID=2053611 RepID=UPI003FA2D387
MMNNVQTNLMSVTPAPNPSAKTNAADAVRPVDKVGSAADRGARNPSFGKMLAKVKAMAQASAETADQMSSDPLAASLAASQQTKPEQKAASVENTEVADIAAVEQSTQDKATAAGAKMMRAEVSAANLVSAFAEESLAVQQEPASTSEAGEAVSLDAAANAPSTPQGQTQMQTNVPQLNYLDAWLTNDEAAGAKDLLRALSGKNQPQPSQTVSMDGKAVVEPALKAVDVNALRDLETMEIPVQAANLTTNVEDDAPLSDALLRMLTASSDEPSVLSVQASVTNGQRQAASAPHLADNSMPLTSAALDAKANVLNPSDAAGQETMQNPAEDGSSGFLNQQSSAQEQKPNMSVPLTQTASVQASEEGAAKAKANPAMQIFQEALQTPQTGQENAASQSNPAVTFQTALHEAAAPQQEVPMTPQKDYEVARQIVEQARLLRMPEQTEMVIRLKPEHLGELTLKVSVAASGAVNAAFHTDNAAVRTIIETSMIQLKQELQAQGLKVDNVGVYAGLSDSSLMNGQQDANAYYAQQGRQGSSQGRDAQQALASFEEEQQVLAAAAGRSDVLAQDGVDYRI